MSAQIAAEWIANWEGSTLVTDPWPSRYGISARYHPQEDIQGMTLERAAAIFTQQYWPAHASELPDYLSTPFLSFSVLEGPTQAVYALQRALAVKADGGIGPQTLAAAATTASVDKRDAFLTAFFRACRARFAESPRWSLDGEGWEARQLAASLAAKSWAP